MELNKNVSAENLIFPAVILMLKMTSNVVEFLRIDKFYYNIKT